MPGFLSAKVILFCVTRYWFSAKCLVLLHDVSTSISMLKALKENNSRAFKIGCQLYNTNLMHFLCQLSLQVQHLKHHDDIYLGFKTIQVFYFKIKQVHRGVGNDIVKFHLSIFDIGNIEIK